VWLAALYAASVVAWAGVALAFGKRAALLTTGLVLVFPGYSLLFHGLASDALFAAGFAGWALLLIRSLLHPKTTTFLVSGLAMGLLVLVRPSNQVLIVVALLPLLLAVPWRRRLAWVASFFVASVAVTQGWKALADLRYSDAVALKPSTAAVVTALVLVPFIVPRVWRRRLLVAAVPLAVAVVVTRGLDVENPTQYARSVAQSPASDVFLFRAFEIDGIVEPDNGSASRQLARAVERELLTKEPYRSYGVDLDEFFSSRSDRIFGDLQSLGGSADLPAVTQEAIRAHPKTFFTGIARTAWDLLWTNRVFAPETGERGPARPSQEQAPEFIVVDGKRLPRPGDGQPIPASRIGPYIRTLYGQAREVWRSPTEHPMVFDDPRDEHRYANFERATERLSARLPTRDGNPGLVHRLNQGSRAFPPAFFWLVIGLVAFIVRRPRSALAALAPSIAALAVILGTSLVALPVAEYAAPVAPAFLMLAAVGLFGERPERARCA
jgi:hypothetical protein